MTAEPPVTDPERKALVEHIKSLQLELAQARNREAGLHIDVRRLTDALVDKVKP